MISCVSLSLCVIETFRPENRKQIHVLCYAQHTKHRPMKENVEPKPCARIILILVRGNYVSRKRNGCKGLGWFRVNDYSLYVSLLLLVSFILFRLAKSSKNAAIETAIKM